MNMYKIAGWTEDDLLWYWLANIKGIGLTYAWKLLEEMSSVRDIWEAGKGDLTGILPDKEIRILIKSRASFDPLESVRALEDSGTRFVHWMSQDYPDRLRDIYQPPVALYVRGRLPDPSQPSLAMVGSRRATNYGKSIAREYARILGQAGVQIISGLAAGIDTESHRGALEGGGYTAGVLGGGIDTVYPRTNFNLYYDMYSLGGVISEYNMGIPNHSGLFPVRNRIISGLSDGILVVEAGLKSGSLITAYQGLEQGKDIFALPGRVTDRMSRGCNDLIAEGAQPVRSPEDIFQVLLPERIQVKGDKESALGEGGDMGKRTAGPRDRILEAMDLAEGMSFDGLQDFTGMEKKELERMLFDLELNGIIFQPVQGLYQKKLKIFSFDE